MVGQGGAGPAGRGWSVSTRTFRREHPSRRAARGALRPRRRLAFVGRGTGFRRGPRAGRSRPLFGPSLFPVAAGGGGMERRRRGRGGTIPAGRAGRAQCLLGAARGASGAFEWGGILGAAAIPLRRGWGPSMPRPLPQLFQAVNSFASRSYFSWTQESGHPSSQLPRQEWRPKTKAPVPFQVMDPAAPAPSPLVPQT